MLKILNSQQIKILDKCTIEHDNIKSIDLMERAALALFESLCGYLSEDDPMIIFAGTGNNGGDALALARMLSGKSFSVEVYLINPEAVLSPDCAANKECFERLLYLNEIKETKDIPFIPSGSIVVDGIFGSGLNRPLSGLHLDVVKRINASASKVYSIDMPSGLFMEDNSANNPDGIIQADIVFTFQLPKLSLLLPENGRFCSKIKILDIGLNKACMAEEKTDYFYTECCDAASLIKKRETFSHKGSFGHALLFAGSYGKMGAAVLAAKSCLRAGVGLLTMHIPRCGVDILQVAVPEAMVDADQEKEYISRAGEVADKKTIGIGPGIGMHSDTSKLLAILLQYSTKPVVIDADALNLIAQDEQLMSNIPHGSILTPHPVEFERLVGKRCVTGYERLQEARHFAQEYSVYIVLKGAYTAIVTPERKVYFNSTGNPGMSTGGSGDVLTGILTSLLAQGYSSLDSAVLGVYLHGLAADLAVLRLSQYSLLPSDIIDYLGKAYRYLEKCRKSE
ncbi:bifunctional ADP-dependent NAD(P)H-hydrate dehydratase/NAD(P)H-hydrate epimerase [Dysgonomonas macrotermitis]|uniref:Bifunctional NAD(P)H-hydrate repair enzyme n=1 Tax=Dysgonomonas macrotermitis TaxID=1346286 RepID=A0A1M5H3A1_9BACT|nr:bifunctional ADP-dependent NAD(P)H-hydrate dehydratase/NAD(P)H-hydrate epimerase [Dysgonomonas macrotermitis]SHG10378.1 NAD(P)H-hydrate epimerase [Dysgonomonas macrotermitis]